ncbi:protein of unknown function [Marivirga sericea]|uniref:DUF4348 domain-containing protein n=1 Tax=Marivirga sericea TaxID=1028 RepID=A0A1X7LLM1_9BACT|nr:DUF4348 domain-containing protein [Marivirga sericea]SMG54233.1 protein of unknown function [Marivirga sericea]
MKYLILLTTFFTLSCESPSSEKEAKETVAEESVLTTSRDSINQELPDTTVSEDISTQTFMEFFSQFMWDRDFQRSRIEYPIKIDAVNIVEKSDWEHLSFYTNKSSMPILHFDTLTYFDKDIREEDISMYILSFENDNAKKYSFAQKAENWRLFSVNTVSINSLKDLEFIDFLKRFSSDSIYQTNHIEFPLTRFFADYNNDYETARDSIGSGDWGFWNLIKSTEALMVLDVEQRTQYRTIFFRGIENGIHVKYTFIRSGDSWQLIKLEDYST